MKPTGNVRPLALALLTAGNAPGDEPEVDVLSPGLLARPLPFQITNVNALTFAPDGRLYAVAYDGRILPLVDSDGDGVEDKSEPFRGSYRAGKAPASTG